MSGTSAVPVFPGRPCKDDGIFMFGATRATKPWVFAYVQEGVEVVHGPSCNVGQEIRLDACSADGVPVIRRRGGGGTVVLSPGMVITVVVGDRSAGDGITGIFARVHEAVIGLLDPTGALGVAQRGISDLAVGDRKILGSSLYLPAKIPFYFYCSSLMVESDPVLIGRYLQQPARQPAYRGNRNHDAFCTTLRQQGHPLAASEVRSLLAGELAAALCSHRSPMTDDR